MPGGVICVSLAGAYLEHLTELFGGVRGTRVADGVPAQGAAGFRRSHLAAADAYQAARDVPESRLRLTDALSKAKYRGSFILNKGTDLFLGPAACCRLRWSAPMWDDLARGTWRGWLCAAGH